MDAEFVKYLSTLGIGGILAGFMFVVYRKDMRQYTDQWRRVTDVLMEVVKDNTASNTKLTSLIETQERNALRKTDVEALIAIGRRASDKG